MVASDSRSRIVKVLVWDLDETLWSGTLLEGDDVEVRPGAVETIKNLDKRGILQSVASRNEPDSAMKRLHDLGLGDYFLCPQIGWDAKSAGIGRIASSINVGLDTIAFIDDQPFEREEVSHVHPQVLTLSADELDGLLERPEFNPRFITNESAIRRQMYRADITRDQEQGGFSGPEEEFLASLGMRFTIASAQEEDLKRAEELTVRTNQLNSTGITYSYQELETFRESDDHQLLVAELTDKYGTYGKIGLALLEMGSQLWTLHLLLMSCRVMARGVGTILLSHIQQQASLAGARLQAKLRATDRNRMMRVAYCFSGFTEVAKQGDIAILEADPSKIQGFASYVEVVIHDAHPSRRNSC